MAVGAKVYIKQQNAIIERIGCMDELEHIDVPTLIISAHQDQIAHVKDSLAMKEKIPNSKLTLLDSCGHFSPLEKSQEIKAAVEDFLS